MDVVRVPNPVQAAELAYVKLLCYSFIGRQQTKDTVNETAIFPVDEHVVVGGMVACLWCLGATDVGLPPR